MKIAILPAVLFSVIFVTGVSIHRANAATTLGVGNYSLLGGDLTDPQDKIKPEFDCGGDLSEEELKPENCGWVSMKCFPANPPGSPPHQRHPYQSWQGSPASAIFWNLPESKKWYVGFKDGGYGGPVEVEPYYCAVELKDAFTLTHFTVTTSPDMPNRDPKSWAIQGSNTGKDDDWTNIYRLDAKDRNGSPFREQPRGMTTLFASFTSDTMAKAVAPKDLKKLQAKLGFGKLKKTDFSRPAKAYTWFRIVVYSCFNQKYLDICQEAGLKALAWADAPALISKEGKRDVKWEHVKKINNRIAKLGPTLVKVTSTGVYCTDPLPIGTRRLAPDAPVKKAEGGAMVIGCFKDAEGREYIMPVNRSFHNKIAAKLAMDEKTASVSEISQQTGELVEAQTLVGGLLEVPLEAGEGRMFLLHQKP